MIFSILFLLSLILQLFFWGVVVKFLLEKKTMERSEYPSVSVVIAARNEAENLQKKLPSILNQDYPSFEVIVVNDRSEDNSLEVLQEFERIYPSLFSFISITEKPKNWNGKKYALQKGIQKAKNEIILLTDADCWTMDKFWIQEMVKPFKEKETNCVLGVSLYELNEKTVSNPFLRWFIRNETLIVALQYLSFAKAGMAYMGVGRNLAYRKSTIFDDFKQEKEKNGFEKLNLDFVSQLGGDDDLIFGNKIFYDKTSVCITGQTQSSPPSNFEKWFRQKRRHLSVGTKYTLRQKIIASTYPLSILLWYMGLFGFLWKGFYEVLGLEILRQLIFFAVLRIFCKKIGRLEYYRTSFSKAFFTNFLGFEWVFIWYYFFMGVSSVFSPPKKWN